MSRLNRLVLRAERVTQSEEIYRRAERLGIWIRRMSRHIDHHTTRRFMLVGETWIYPRAWDRRPRLAPLLTWAALTFLAGAIAGAALVFAFSAVTSYQRDGAGRLDAGAARSSADVAAVRVSASPPFIRAEDLTPASEDLDAVEVGQAPGFTTQSNPPRDDPARILAMLPEDPGFPAIFARDDAS